MPYAYRPAGGDLTSDFYSRQGYYPSPMRTTQQGLEAMGRDALSAATTIGGLLVPQTAGEAALSLIPFGRAATLGARAGKAMLAGGLLAIDDPDEAQGATKKWMRLYNEGLDALRQRKAALEAGDKHTAFATHEAIPGISTGHLPGAAGADEAARRAYTLDPRSTWANAPLERDAIYAGLGIPGTGVNMRVRPTQPMQGFYTDETGRLQTNLGEVARPLVNFDSGKVKTISPADRSILDAGEMTRAYVDAQDAGAWNKPWTGGQAGKSNSLFMPMNRQAEVDEMLKLRDAVKPHGLTDIVDTSQGLLATNFSSGPPKIGKGLIADVPNAVPDGAAAPRRVKVDAGYMSLADEWKAGEGSGAATRAMLKKINNTPELRTAFDQNPYIPKNALARLERDEEWATKFGATRADIQNARRIIGAGPGWVGRLEEGLRKGALLPGVGAAILAAAEDGGS